PEAEHARHVRGAIRRPPSSNLGSRWYRAVPVMTPPRLRRAFGSALLALALLQACSGDSPAAPLPPGSVDPIPSPDDVIFAHVYYKDVEDLQRIAGELDALEEADRQAGWVGVLLSPDQYDEMIAAGYRIDVVGRERPGRLRSIANYSCYRTVEETYAAM